MSGMLSEAIRRFDVRDWLSERVRVHKSGPTNISANECPICGKKAAKFYVNASGGAQNGSFTAYCCSNFGGLLLLVELVEGVSREDALDLILDRLAGEDNRIVPVIAVTPVAEPSSVVELPNPTHPAQSSYPMVVKGVWRTIGWRGADDATIARHRLGITHIGTTHGGKHLRSLNHRLIVPIFRAGALIGWQARDLTDTHDRKYLFPPGDRSSEWLYDLDSHEGSVMLIVEGVFHKWAWDRFGRAHGMGYDRMAVASFGKKLTAAQLDLLIERPAITDVILAWDLDAAPEIDYVARALIGRKRVHVMPAHPDGRDHDELSDLELAERLAAIRPYTPELGIAMKTSLAAQRLAKTR